MEAAISRLTAAGLVAGTLFATSIAETFLPHRSAEITDTVMALAIAAVSALLTKGEEIANTQPGLRRSFAMPTVPSTSSGCPIEIDNAQN